jgi:V8-like Glu-specific endopeptidase
LLWSPNGHSAARKALTLLTDKTGGRTGRRALKRPGLSRPGVLAAAVIGAVAAGVALSPATGRATSERAEIASFGVTSTVGALFTLTANGQLGTHYCTGSVVDSPSGDLVVTAAHCVNQSSVGRVAFVPDYAAGKGPFGVWIVRQVIEDKKWSSSEDPDDDYAFLVVSQPGSKTAIEELTGGEVIGVNEPAGRKVEVAGYPDGRGELISCENTALDYSPTQLRFNCGGFTDGTSGSPLLADGTLAGSGAAVVIGVIGGYEKGGATASVSYAARFSADLAALYKRALSAGR